MDVNFLFLDECICNETAIASLTGLLIPVDKYSAIRASFYETLDWAIKPAESTMGFPPELHGCEFLRGESDDRKLQQFAQVVGLLRKHDLRVFRVGYYQTAKAKNFLKTRDDFIGLCWFGMISVCQPYFVDQKIIPIMDGFNDHTRLRFSGMIKSMDVFRASGLAAGISIDNSENIVGEVFYADSTYSVFTQIVDILSYLRHVSDWVREGKPLTDFKSQLAEISKRLEPAIAYESVIDLKTPNPA